MVAQVHSTVQQLWLMEDQALPITQLRAVMEERLQIQLEARNSPAVTGGQQLAVAQGAEEAVPMGPRVEMHPVQPQVQDLVL
jgi:hypothetical protein